MQVRTHVWHGWDLLQNRKTGKFVLNSNTYAQYHCKLPTDPDAQKPPKDEPPEPPKPPPKPPKPPIEG